MINLSSLGVQIKSNIVRANLVDISDTGLCTIKLVGVQIQNVPIDLQLVSVNSTEAAYLRDWYYLKISPRLYLKANVGKLVYVHCDQVNLTSLDVKLVNPTVIGLVGQYPVFQLAVKSNEDGSYYTAGRLTSLENATQTDVDPILSDYYYVYPQNLFGDEYTYSNNGQEQLVDTFYVTEDSAESALLKNNAYPDYYSWQQQTGMSKTNTTFGYIAISPTNFVYTDNVAAFNDKIVDAITALPIEDKRTLADALYSYVLRFFIEEGIAADYTDDSYVGSDRWFIYDTGLLPDIRQIDQYHINSDTLSDSDVENYLSMVLFYLVPSNIFSHLRAIQYGLAYQYSNIEFNFYSSVFKNDLASWVNKYANSDLDGNNYISYSATNLRPMFGLSVYASPTGCTAGNSVSYGTSSGRFGSKCYDTRYTTDKYHISSKAYSIYYDFVSPYPMLDETISAYTTISHGICGTLVDTRDGNGGTVETSFLKFDDDVRYLYISRTKDGQNMSIIEVAPDYSVKTFSLPFGFLSLLAPLDFYEN